jgi:hypothetical protein
MERKVKPSSEAKTAKSAKSIKICAVGTVSGGGCVQRKEESKALQQGKDGQFGQVHQEHPSVSRVRRRLGGEERKKVKVNTTIKNTTV